MSKKLDSNKKPWSKIFSWTALGLTTSASLLAIGFGVTNFVKFGSHNKGTGYDDSVQIQLQSKLPETINGTPITDEQSLKYSEGIAKNIAKITNVLGAEEIQIQSGIQKGQVSPESSQQITYANNYLHTTKNFLSYDLDFSDKVDPSVEKPEDVKARQDNVKLSLYYRLAQNYNYWIQDATKWMNRNATTTPVANPNFTTNAYKLNNATTAATGEQVTKAYKSVTDQLMFDLRPNKATNDKNTTWDLSAFQKQFTTVYKWDGSKTQTRQEVIDSAANSETSITLDKPETSYIFFRNRSGLINLLQNLTTIATLNNNRSSLDVNSLTRVEKLYELVAQNFEYKTFMEWVVKASGYNWSDIMLHLYHAQSKDFGVKTVGSNTTDPLLDLLNSYYVSSEYFGAHSSDTNSGNPNGFMKKNYKDFEFLYSWNFKNDTFISQYLVPIDYNNWFTFFEQDATKEELDNKEYVKQTYLAKKMDTDWAIYDYSIGSLPGVIDVLNNAAIEEPFVNYNLTPLINQYTGQQANKLYDAYFNNFLDCLVTTISNTQSSSITGINAFNGAVIGLSAAVVLIGIIVSILYRVPGLLSAFAGATSFGLNLLMMSNLNITFAMSSVFALITGIVAMFIPFFYGMKEFRKAFRQDKLNLNNSFKKGMTAFIRSSILIHLSLLITALVFLFLGTHQTQNFGAVLTLMGVSNFVCSGFLMMVMFGLMYFVLLRQKPNLMFNKNDIAIINNIKKNRSKFDDEIIISRSPLDKLSGAIANGIIQYDWRIWVIISAITILAIVGTTLLFTIGPSRSFYYEYSNQISLIFQNTPENQNIAQTLADQLALQLNVQWVQTSLYQGIYANGYSQMLLVPSVAVNPSDVYILVGKLQPTWATNVQVLSIDTFFTDLIVNNLVQCVFVSVAFLAILNLLLLNIINVIPIFISSLLTIGVGCAVIAISRVGININTIAAFSAVFIVLQLLIEFNFMNLKYNYDMKARMSKQEILAYSLEQVKSSFTISMSIIGCLWVVVFIMVLFDSSTNLFNYLMIWLISIFGFVGVIALTPVSFAGFMILRELYVSRVANPKNHKHKHKSYDKIDEQIIVGINHS